MKKSLMVVLTVVCIVVFSGILVADDASDARAAARKQLQEEKSKTAKKANQAKNSEQAKGGQAATAVSRTSAARGPGLRNPANREDMIKQRTKMMEQQFAKEAESHKAFVAKLNSIKKIAKSENATKTVAELEKLIAETNNKFEKKVKAKEENVKRYTEMMKNRPTTRPRPQQGQKREQRGAGAEKKADEVK